MPVTKRIQGGFLNILKSFFRKISVHIPSNTKAVKKRNHTTVTGGISFTATFMAMARNPHKNAVKDAYIIPFPLLFFIAHKERAIISINENPGLKSGRFHHGYKNGSYKKRIFGLGNLNIYPVTLIFTRRS